MIWVISALIYLLPSLACAVPSKHVLIAKVVRVIDGDTITILTADSEQERIRLYGIDAPENRGGQPFWKASRDQLAAPRQINQGNLKENCLHYLIGACT